MSQSEFSAGTKPILDLHWMWTQDASHDLLAALHAPSSLVLWNADTGTKLWKKTFQESLLCFAFDPFSPSKVTCKLVTRDRGSLILANFVRKSLCFRGDIKINLIGLQSGMTAIRYCVTGALAVCMSHVQYEIVLVTLPSS